MTAQVRVQEYRFAENQGYDIFLAALGYETRARFVVEQMAPNSRIRIAYGFDSDHIFDYQKNKSWFESHNYYVDDVSDDEFSVALKQLITKMEGEAITGRGIRVGVDVSSQTRLRLALFLRAIAESVRTRITVDFFYAVADFSDAPALASPNTHVGPVLPSFAGWWYEPERPVAAVVGLGYEENKALGAVEHIQASSIYTYTPVSPVQAYSPALEQANATLLRQIKPDRRFVYDLTKPFNTFVALESFAFGVTRSQNLVILPFGPKLFALCSLLLGITRPELAVWRVSGGENRINRKAFGPIYALTAEFVLHD